MKPLVSKWVSSAVGKLMDARISKIFIKSFVRRNKIDVSDYVTDNIISFNDFFTRKIKDGKRPLADDTFLIAPCDGKLTVYPINSDIVIPVKQSMFSISRMLVNDTLAKEFDGGLCLVFRLSVENYHRYVYIDSGLKEENIHINGIYHTVRPIALSEFPVFTENTRDYTVIRNDAHGTIIQMEVGAMLVGKIDNYERHETTVKRGEEKGRFLFGGSTIIVLLEKDRVKINTDILDASKKEKEVPVKLGTSIGRWL